MNDILYKRALRLKEKKYRVEYGQTLTEGVKVIKDLAERGIFPVYLLVDENEKEKLKNTFSEFAKKKTVIDHGESHLIKKITDTEKNMVAVGIYDTPSVGIAENPSKPASFLFHKTQDPLNLGNIIRTCAWFGIGEIFLYECVEPFNPKVVRASVGAVFSVKMRMVKNISSFISVNGFRTVAVYENGKIPLREFEFKDGDIYIFGNEGSGISRDIIEGAGASVRIESGAGMRIDSLNLQTAAALFAYSYMMAKK